LDCFSGEVLTSGIKS
jgi:hypothetical protein